MMLKKLFLSVVLCGACIAIAQPTKVEAQECMCPCACPTPTPTAIPTPTPTPIPTPTPVVVAGKFPVGIYHISHYPGQDAKRLVDMREIKRLGFDYIATPIDTGDAAVFTLAEELDLGVMVEYNGDMTAVNNAFKNSKALFAHIPGDDVDLRKINGLNPTPELYKIEDAKYRALNPNLKTLASVAMAANAWKYAGISDKTAQQCYPIGNGVLTDTNWCYERLRDAQAAKGLPFLAHVQTSKWSGQRYPTANEFTAMAWAAIAFGTKEILMYTYFDYGANQVVVTDLATQPGLRSAIQTFITKLRGYEGYLLNGKLVTTKTSTGVTGVWTYAEMKKKLTITVKYSPTPSVTFAEVNL